MSEAAAAPVVQIDHVTVLYGEQAALRDVSAVFPAGAVGLLGPNGAGKSTLLKALLGFLPSNNLDDPPFVATDDDPERRDPKLNELVPDNPNKPYDIKELIYKVVDEGGFFELAPDFAKNIVTGLARMDGSTVGIVANQRMRVQSKTAGLQMQGVIYADSADKGASVAIATMIEPVSSANIRPSVRILPTGLPNTVNQGRIP